MSSAVRADLSASFSSIPSFSGDVNLPITQEPVQCDITQGLTYGNFKQQKLPDPSDKHTSDRRLPPLVSLQSHQSRQGKDREKWTGRAESDSFDVLDGCTERAHTRHTSTASPLMSLLQSFSPNPDVDEGPWDTVVTGSENGCRITPLLQWVNRENVMPGDEGDPFPDDHDDSVEPLQNEPAVVKPVALEAATEGLHSKPRGRGKGHVPRTTKRNEKNNLGKGICTAVCNAMDSVRHYLSFFCRRRWVDSRREMAECEHSREILDSAERMQRTGEAGGEYERRYSQDGEKKQCLMSCWS